MSVEVRGGSKKAVRGRLNLPPIFREVVLRESGNAFAHAQEIAPQAGAGTLVWVGRFDLVEFAVVLEPDEPLVSARRAIFAGLAALADALAVHAPPEMALYYDFPATLTFNNGLIGGGQLAWPVGTKENERPDWLVFGAMVRMHVMDNLEPGERVSIASMEEEGFDDLAAATLLESFSRHLMTHLDEWQNNGFANVARSYLARLPVNPDVERTIDGAGDLLTRTKGKAEVKKQKLLPALERALWLDHKTGEILL